MDLNHLRLEIEPEAAARLYTAEKWDLSVLKETADVPLHAGIVNALRVKLTELGAQSACIPRIEPIRRTLADKTAFRHAVHLGNRMALYRQTGEASGGIILSPGMTLCAALDASAPLLVAVGREIAMVASGCWVSLLGSGRARRGTEGYGMVSAIADAFRSRKVPAHEVAFSLLVPDAEPTWIHTSAPDKGERNRRIAERLREQYPEAVGTFGSLWSLDLPSVFVTQVQKVGGSVSVLQCPGLRTLPRQFSLLLIRNVA